MMLVVKMVKSVSLVRIGVLRGNFQSVPKFGHQDFSGLEVPLTRRVG